MKLVFLATDPHFSENLKALRDWRIQERKFDDAFTIIIDGQAIVATSARVRLDGWFEHDGYRVKLERVDRVELYL